MPGTRTDFVAKADGWRVAGWPMDDDVEMTTAATYKLYKTNDTDKAIVEIWHIYEAVLVEHEGQNTPVAYGCAAFVPTEMKDGSDPQGFAVFTDDNEVFPGGQ